METSIRYPAPVEEKETLATSSIYSNGKVNLPQKVLKALGVKSGARIVWVKEKSRDGAKVYVEAAVKTV